MRDCLFCKIVEKKIPAKIVEESDNAICFSDINPQAPHHLLVIPKRHVENTDALTGQDLELVGGLVLEAVRIARKQNLHKAGYRLVLNCNADGGQTVPHLHIHILGGRRMTWPPG